MFAIFRENENLREIEILENPFPVKTERESAVEEKELPVFRRLFVKIIKKRQATFNKFPSLF